MERTEPEDAGAEGLSARPGAPGNRATTAVDQAERTTTGPGRERHATTAPAPTNRAMTSFSPADEEKRRGVRQMKLTATGLLLFVAVVYVLATWASHEGAGPWAGYVAAAAEAGMVGALADWFAVTALFRHPLGLPIPHTAIIPTKKDQLGVSLGEFVGENFLSSDVVRQRLRAVGIGSRLGAWLAEPEHADRVTAELAAALRGALTVLRDSDVQAVVGEAITRRADAQEIAPGIGKMLEKIVADGGHKRVVDLVCIRAHDWLVLHDEQVMDAIQGGAPGWTPRFVDKKVGERVRDARRPLPPGPRCPRPLPHRLRLRPPVRHRHPRARGAPEGRGARPRRGPGPDRLRLDGRTVHDRVRRRGRAQ
jgi:hypothetical protein